MAVHSFHCFLYLPLCCCCLLNHIIFAAADCRVDFEFCCFSVKYQIFALTLVAICGQSPLQVCESQLLCPTLRSSSHLKCTYTHMYCLYATTSANRLRPLNSTASQTKVAADTLHQLRRPRAATQQRKN